MTTDYQTFGNSFHRVAYRGERMSNFVVNCDFAAIATAAGTTVARPQRFFAASMAATARAARSWLM